MTACASPLPFDTLVALWAGELPAEQTLAAEEHLFGCDPCSLTSDRLGNIVSGLRGLVPPVVSRAHYDRLLEQGTRIRLTHVQPGVDATAHFTRDVDLLVHVLHADLSRATRVDVEFIGASETASMAMEAAPFDAERGEILVACQRHYELFVPPGVQPKFRVHALEAGQRRHVGDYLVIHIWNA